MSAPRFLDEPRSILDAYLYICGESEVPRSYQIWCGIAVIAAVVEDRVWVTKFDRLFPNLYIGLLGPSANGKGEAISIATKILRRHPKVGMFYGRVTAQYLLSYMSHNRRCDDGVERSNRNLIMIMPELSMSLPKGDGADTFIKQVTDMYTGRGDVPLMEGTITRSLNALRDGWCLNWLFGSVVEWLLDVIPATAISGGTFGRIVGVHEGYDWSRRYEMPVWPGDRAEVLDHLHARLDELSNVEGEFTLTPSARQVMHRWYNERSRPDDDSLVPAWKRQHDLVLKLAMILSLSDGLDLRIKDDHVYRAQALSESVIRRLADIQAAAATSKDTQGLVFVRGLFKSLKRPLGRTELLRRFTSKGLGLAPELEAVLQTMIQGGEIRGGGLGRGTIYEFMGRRRMPKSAANGAAPDEPAAQGENE